MSVDSESISPKSVALAAYQAALSGQFAAANRLLAPSVLKDLAKAHRETTAAGKQLRLGLAKLKGRRDPAAVRLRRILRQQAQANRQMAALKLGSQRLFNELWEAMTRGRSVVRVEATRQVIRGAKARVYLRLVRTDGSVIKDSELLVWSRGRWLLG